MRTESVAPFTIALKPSPRLAWLLALAHFMGCVIVVILDVPLWVAIPLVSGLIAHGAGQVLRVALLRAGDSVVELKAGHPGDLPFRTRNGEWHDAQLLGSSYVSPQLTVLNLKLTGARGVRHAVIAADAVDPEEFRRLRVWLRWGSGAAIARPT